MNPQQPGYDDEAHIQPVPATPSKNFWKNNKVFWGIIIVIIVVALIWWFCKRNNNKSELLTSQGEPFGSRTIRVSRTTI